MKHRDVGFCFQSMRISSGATVGVRTGIRGEASPLYVRSNVKRSTTPSVLDVVNSFDGLSFARREGSSNSNNHFVESLKTFV